MTWLTTGCGGERANAHDSERKGDGDKCGVSERIVTMQHVKK